MTCLVFLAASGCRLGFDLLPGGAEDDGGPQIDADPLAPDADPSLVDAGLPDAEWADATAASVTETQQGQSAPESASDLISIEPVLLSESFVTCSRRSSVSNPHLNLARCQLVDGSTLRVASNALDSSAVTAWSVVQVPGAEVQRGTETFAISDVTRDVTIAAVDRTATFALLTSSSAQTGVDDDERTNFMVELSSDTNLRLTRGSNGVAATVDYQVIQLPSTNVQSGVTTLGVAETTKSAPLTTVDLARSFVVHSRSVGADVDGAEAVYMTGSSISATDVTFSREAAAEPVQVSWFAVELPAESSVKTHELQTAAPHDQTEFEFSDGAYNPRMLAFTSVEIDSGILRTSLNAASFTSVVGDGRVILTRNASDGNQVQIRTTVVDIVMPPTP